MADPHDDPTHDDVVAAPEGSLASGVTGGDTGPAHPADGPEGEVTEAGTVSVAPFVDDDAIDANDLDARLADADAAPDADAERDADTDHRVTGGRSRGKAKGTTSDKAAAGATTGPTVTRRVVTSKRVTPKGGGQTGSPTKKVTAQADDEGGFTSSRRSPPGGQGAYAKGPSPWWVPTLMFGLLIIGALVIMSNYMGVFGDAQNSRLVIGLAFILGGIVTATQYR